MALSLDPYVMYYTNAREALTYYQSIFGGELDLRTFRQLGMETAPGEEEFIMHGALTTADGLVIMGADYSASVPKIEESRISIALSGDDEAKLTDFFNKLSEGGSIGQELQKASWGDSFGMVVDKYGLRWMVNISGGQAQAPTAA